MNKLKQLRRRLIRGVGIALGVMCLFVGLLLVTGSFADSSAQKKQQASSQLSLDQSQLNNLRTQFTKSGEAEKRFAEIILYHPNPDYQANSDTLKTMLRKSKEQFRFADNFKLTLAQEKISEKPEFSGLNYDIAVREPMRITLEAISDAHVFSFIDHLRTQAPGLVRITRLEVKRKDDIDSQILGKMNAGDAPALVEATLDFTWVGVQARKAEPAEAKPKSAGAP